MTVTSAVRAVLLAPFLAIAYWSVAAADVYEIDRDHTEVRFTWDHVGMSRQGARFRDVSGTLNFDPVNPGNSSVDVRIKVASISTGVAKLDDHLVRSGEFFDVQSFPNITFKSTSVAPTAGRTAQVTGNLAMNGMTKPVVLNVRWNFSGEHPLGSINPVYKEVYVSGFSATATILRSDWGLSRTVPFISDELRVTIETEFHRKQITSPQLPAEGAGLSPAPGGPPQVGPPQPAGQGLQVPEPGAPAPLPPVEGGPPHSATLPPATGAPPQPAGPQPPSTLPNDALTPEALPDDSAEQGPAAAGAPAGEPLDPVERLDN